jgi:hypothetical protein
MKMRHVQTAIWQGWTANLLMIVLVSVAQADSIEGSFSNDFGELIYSRDAGSIGMKDPKRAVPTVLTSNRNGSTTTGNTRANWSMAGTPIPAFARRSVWSRYDRSSASVASHRDTTAIAGT